MRLLYPNAEVYHMRNHPTSSRSICGCRKMYVLNATSFESLYERARGANAIPDLLDCRGYYFWSSNGVAAAVRWLSDGFRESCRDIEACSVVPQSSRSWTMRFSRAYYSGDRASSAVGCGTASLYNPHISINIVVVGNHVENSSNGSRNPTSVRYVSST